MFGLCCQSCLTPKITASTTTTITYLKTLKKSDQGPYLIQKAKVNISALEILLRNSMANGIQAFRISDSLIPMADLGLFDIEK